MSRPATLRVGFLEGATYPDGTRVALVAAVQEYGSAARGIPPRPFFRGMVRAKSAGWPAVIRDGLRKYDMDAEKALRSLGEVIQGQLKLAIRDFVGTPLKAATIRRKGFDKALIDTGHMLNSVDYEVKS